MRDAVVRLAAGSSTVAILAGPPAAIRPAELPADLAARCIDLSAALGLSLAGIDLRRTPEGDWYCFEVNTCPGFTYFEEDDEKPITEAVARLLVAGS